MKDTPKFLTSIEALTGRVDQIVQFFLVVIFIVLFGMLNLQVISRYVVRAPIIWVEELSGFFLAFLTLMGGSCCIRANRHVQVHFIYDRVKGTLFGHLLFLFINAVLLVYVYYLIRYGYLFAQMGIGEKTPSGTFTFFIPRLSMAVGGSLMAIQIIFLMIREFTGFMMELAGRIEKKRE